MCGKFRKQIIAVGKYWRRDRAWVEKWFKKKSSVEKFGASKITLSQSQLLSIKRMRLAWDFEMTVFYLTALSPTSHCNHTLHWRCLCLMTSEMPMGLVADFREQSWINTLPKKANRTGVLTRTCPPIWVHTVQFLCFFQISILWGYLLAWS